jgi:hypothetical protein
MKVKNNIYLEVNNSFLTLANLRCELEVTILEDGEIIYGISLFRTITNEDYPIEEIGFKDMGEAMSWMEYTCKTYVTKELEERIESGNWAKTRLETMNEFGMFN